MFTQLLLLPFVEAVRQRLVFFKNSIVTREAFSEHYRGSDTILFENIEKLDEFALDLSAHKCITQ